MREPAPDLSPPSPLKAVARVRVLLDALGDALISWRLGAIEALEGDLKDAVAALQFDALPPLDDSTRRALARELARSANALGRCRRLGASFSELIRFHAQALGETDSYNAVGEKTATGAASVLRMSA